MAGWLNLSSLGVSEPVQICLRLMYSSVMLVPVPELRPKLPRLKIKLWNQLELSFQRVLMILVKSKFFVQKIREITFHKTNLQESAICALFASKAKINVFLIILN